MKQPLYKKDINYITSKRNVHIHIVTNIQICYGLISGSRYSE